MRLKYPIPTDKGRGSKSHPSLVLKQLARLKDYLSKLCNNRNSGKVRMSYAKHYTSVLTSMYTPANLLQLSPQKRLNVMKSHPLVLLLFDIIKTTKQRPDKFTELYSTLLISV